MIWLGIDTANQPLSVAVMKDGIVLAELNSSTSMNHSVRAMPAIEEVCRLAEITPADIDAIAVSEGPGSYTGVRIGVTIAKTLAWTLQKPLIGISSLQAISANAMAYTGLICPLVDARRGNVYAGVYKHIDGRLETVIEDGHYALEQLIAQLRETKEHVLFIGIDAVLHEETLIEELGDLAQFAQAPLNQPRASALIYLAQQTEATSDPHAFTPEYRRIAEAEANWLKASRGNSGD